MAEPTKEPKQYRSLQQREYAPTTYDVDPEKSSKKQQVRQAIILRDNRDDKVQTAGIYLNSGRKRLAQNALEEAESRLRHRDIVSKVTHGRLGLGIITRSQ